MRRLRPGVKHQHAGEAEASRAARPRLAGPHRELAGQLVPRAPGCGYPRLSGRGRSPSVLSQEGEPLQDGFRRLAGCQVHLIKQ